MNDYTINCSCLAFGDYVTRPSMNIDLAEEDEEDPLVRLSLKNLI